MRKTKKRFLSALLACAMIIGLFPFAAFASTTTPVGTFEALKSAVENAKAGDTIELTANINIPAGQGNNLVIDKAITIDGKNYTIAREFNDTPNADGYGDYEEVFYVQSSGVTIKNVTVTGLDDCMKDEGAVYIATNGTESAPITIDNCKFVGAATLGANSGGSGIISEGGAAGYVTVKDCQFTNLKYGMYFNAINHATITGNTIDGTKYTGIVLGNSSNITVTENTLTNIATENYGDVAYASGIYVANTGATGIKITNNDVTLSANNTNGVAQGSVNAAEINGTQYATLDAAITAASNGDTITLLKDVVLDGANKGNTQGLLTIDGKNITLDGNGYTISAENVSGTPSMINIQYGANVIVKNLTIDGKVSESTATKHGLNVYSATALVENVTIKNGTGYAIVANGSTVTVNGLTTENNKWGGINVDNKSGDASLIVNSATINEENSIKFEKGKVTGNEPSGTINGGSFQYVTTDGKVALKMVVNGGTFATGDYAGAVDIKDYVAPGMEYNPSTGKVDEIYTGKYSYAINVADADNGSVSVDKYATEGEKVTLAVSPDKAYKLDELILTVNGKEVEVTDNGDGTYTFTMPSGNVKVSASFVEDEDYVEP
ncbi:MAG: right-handed parallel beta-helix repeat-containing protein, partial [Peptococcaceae bacterium]|nr:right-handed parallel beta-helix repeat-containing protein [Peptococcaceae bacterium]